MRRLFLTTALVASLAACQTTPAVPVDTTPEVPAAASLADDNLNAVLWMQRSAEYRALTTQTYRAAAEHLDAALADATWDALVPAERDNNGHIARLPPAVILDVDETVLDNSPYQARMIHDGSEYEQASWAAWVEERKAKAIPGVLEFARAAQARGITLIYLSNRREHMQDATLANLRAEGLPVKDDSVFLGQGTVVEGCGPDGSEKRCRRRLAGRQYRVLMQFGDQLGDFAEVAANTPEARAQLLDTRQAWFGERWWMLPNPSYGSWEAAAFDNARDLPRDARRQAKRDSLDRVR
jgi:acid phosphatase